MFPTRSSTTPTNPATSTRPKLQETPTISWIKVNYYRTSTNRAEYLDLPEDSSNMLHRPTSGGDTKAQNLII